MKAWILLFLCLKAYSETQVYEGSVRYEGRFIYAERHTLLLDNDVLISSFTEYNDPQGKKLGFMKTDYSRSLYAPEFLFKDERARYVQGLRRSGPVIEAFGQGPEGKAEVAKIIPSGRRPLVAGPGLFQFAARNMDKIISHGVLRFQYLIPGKLQIYDFIIKVLHHDTLKAEFEVRLESWWLSLFTPRLRLIYDVPQRRLLSFEGLSGLRDEDGDMISVDINYNYSL
jgi:hypothetical protein